MNKLLTALVLFTASAGVMANDATITGPQESTAPAPSAAKVPLPQHPTPQVRAYLLTALDVFYLVNIMMNVLTRLLLLR